MPNEEHDELPPDHAQIHQTFLGATLLNRDNQPVAIGSGELSIVQSDGEFFVAYADLVTVRTSLSQISALKMSDGRLYTIVPEEGMCQAEGNRPPHFHFRIVQ